MKKEKRQGKTKSKFFLTSFYFLAVVFIFSFLYFTSQLVLAQNLSNAERITSFNGEIKINTDSTIDIKETIAYDFGDQEKHGIFRFIPIKYKARGGNFNLRVSNISVTDENGAPYNYAITYPGDDIQIKIGDANKLVSGQKTYVIAYTIGRSINYFPDHDELFWNLTGNQWEIPIEKAAAKIILPAAAKDNLQYKCFQGAYGSTDECQASLSGNILEYSSNGPLEPGEGITVVAGWPKGITKEPTFFQKALDTARDNWTLAAPLIVFVLMFRHWYKRGRDPKGRGTIIAQYESPDELTPAEIGTMVDGSADNKDVSATVIDLAVRGFLKIKRTEEKGLLGLGKYTEYTFVRLKDEEPEKNFEKKTLSGLFPQGKETKLSDLKNKFYQSLKTIKDQLYEDVTQKGYYAKNPNTVFGFWIAIAIVAGFFMAFGFGALQGFWGAASGIVSGIIILIFGWLMPAVTKKGAELKENILGFKDFLSVTEADRLKFHNAPEKNPEMFEKFLPYAMVLGVEGQWAKQFEGIYNQRPNWYEDPSGSVFNAMVLSSFARDFNSSAMSTLSSQPSSAASGASGFGGGGFSGGGFGGGGGGSW